MNDDVVGIKRDIRLVTADATFRVSGTDESESKLDLFCKISPDSKHHYKFAGAQHAVMYHTCYECAFCGKYKCKSYTPNWMAEPLSLPTDEDLDADELGMPNGIRENLCSGAPSTQSPPGGNPP